MEPISGAVARGQRVELLSVRLPREEIAGYDEQARALGYRRSEYLRLLLRLASSRRCRGSIPPKQGGHLVRPRRVEGGLGGAGATARPRRGGHGGPRESRADGEPGSSGAVAR